MELVDSVGAYIMPVGIYKNTRTRIWMSELRISMHSNNMCGVRSRIVVLEMMAETEYTHALTCEHTHTHTYTHSSTVWASFQNIYYVQKVSVICIWEITRWSFLVATFISNSQVDQPRKPKHVMNIFEASLSWDIIVLPIGSADSI